MKNDEQDSRGRISKRLKRCQRSRYNQFKSGESGESGESKPFSILNSQFSIFNSILPASQPQVEKITSEPDFINAGILDLSAILAALASHRRGRNAPRRNFQCLCSIQLSC
ncbi:MAG TPA: hypothetical protein PLL06_23225, partial [Acidobacteriota bacterium]|nr:hypothetical protein [Acidobacteriota bacterium]